MPKSSQAIAIPRQAILFFNIYETHPSKKDLDAYENHLSQIMYIGTGIRP